MRNFLLIATACATLSACSGFPMAVRTTSAPGVRLDTIEDRRAAFAAAYREFRQRPSASSVAVFQALESSYPELADYHLYFAGSALRQLGDDAEAEALLRRLWREYPQSTKAAAGSLELGLALTRLGRGAEARPLLQIAQSSGGAEIANRARFALADLDERSGEYQAAVAGFSEVRRDAAGTALGNDAKKRVLALRAQYPVLDPVGRANVDEARLLLAERDFRSATEIIERLLLAPSNARAGVDEGELLRMLADAFYAMGDVERALALLHRLAERYPDSPVGSGALYRRAMILWNRDRDEEALAVFAAFVDRYPRNDRAAEALYAVGRIHQQAGQPSEAIAAYTHLAREYPGSKMAAEGRWRIGWVHYRNGRFDTAATTFAAAAAQTNDRARDEATYWQARALERLARAGAARELYQRIVRHDPNGYYAMWAEKRLRREPDTKRMLDTSAPPAPQLSLPPPPKVPDPFHLDRALELGLAGVFDLARAELDALESDNDGDTEVSRFVFAAYQAVDGYANILRRLRKRGLPDSVSGAEGESLLYPLAFWNLVRPQAEAHGLDPLLIESLMRQESMFDPRAHSPANARGLMQLLPSTAKQISGAGDEDEIDLYDPEINVELGSRYLHTLLLRFGYDPLKAIAAYNGGEKAVEKWQSRYGDLDPDEFVESITYRETRDYVKKVVANYRKYNRLYRPRS